MNAGATNWAGNLTYGARRVHTPSTLEELQQLVASSDRIRALGSRHSFSEVADTTGDLVSLAGLAPTVALDTERSVVTVAAGMRYGEVCRMLHDRGFALTNLGSLPHISVAGACATATHGSGDANGNLATAVRSLTMVTDDGELRALSRETDGDRFAGAVVGLGALGVVVELTLDVVPTFDVRQEVYEDLPLDTVADRFDDVTSGAYSVSVFTDWAAPTAAAWLKRRVDEPDRWTPEPTWLGARLADGPRHPLGGMAPANCTQQLGVPGPWYARLPHFRLEFTPSVGEEVQSEYLVPRRHGADALRALRRIGHRLAPVLQVSEIRTVAADDLWLSPAYEHDVVGFHFTWVKDTAAVLPVVAIVEAQLARFEARPHWGKLFTVDPGVLPSLFPRLPDFRRLRQELDPSEKFGNAFVDRFVG